MEESSKLQPLNVVVIQPFPRQQVWNLWEVLVGIVCQLHQNGEPEMCSYNAIGSICLYFSQYYVNDRKWRECTEESPLPADVGGIPREGVVIRKGATRRSFAIVVHCNTIHIWGAPFPKSVRRRLCWEVLIPLNAFTLVQSNPATWMACRTTQC